MALLETGGARLDVETTGAGRDLVLLHSLLSDRSAFFRVSPELAKSFRLHLVNLPGYGESRADCATIADYADAVAGIFGALKIGPGAAVLGNGFGGFIALALAIRHGKKFGPLVIADSLATFPATAKEPFRTMAGKVRAAGMGAVLDAAVLRMFPEAFIAAHPDIIAGRKSALAKADGECFARACLALAEVDFGSDLGKIRNRTLVMAGALDRATPARLARELAATIPGAGFREIADCGHCPQIEKPEVFVALVQEFLAAS
jgi:pimeloyl-ACP methyl ester carboxylesterase